jgi:hypothetical protein
MQEPNFSLDDILSPTQEKVEPKVEPHYEVEDVTEPISEVQHTDGGIIPDITDILPERTAPRAGSLEAKLANKLIANPIVIPLYFVDPTCVKAFTDIVPNLAHDLVVWGESNARIKSALVSFVSASSGLGVAGDLLPVLVVIAKHHNLIPDDFITSVMQFVTGKVFGNTQEEGAAPEGPKLSSVPPMPEPSVDVSGNGDLPVIADDLANYVGPTE